MASLEAIRERLPQVRRRLGPDGALKWLGSQLEGSEVNALIAFYRDGNAWERTALEALSGDLVTNAGDKLRWQAEQSRQENDAAREAAPGGDMNAAIRAAAGRGTYEGGDLG
jgi:hypothetical protein